VLLPAEPAWGGNLKVNAVRGRVRLPAPPGRRRATRACVEAGRVQCACVLPCRVVKRRWFFRARRVRKCCPPLVGIGDIELYTGGNGR